MHRHFRPCPARRRVVVSAFVLLAVAPPVATAQPSDQEQLRGAWRVVFVEAEGKKKHENLTPNNRLVFAADRLIMTDRRRSTELTFCLDPSARPRRITLVHEKTKEKLEGIYEIDGEVLRICYSFPGEKPPAEFRTRPGEKRLLLVMRREQPGDAGRHRELDAAREKARRLSAQRKLPEAAAEYEKAVALATRLYGEDHEQTATLQAGLALVYHLAGQPAAARPLFEKSLKTARQWYGPDHLVIERLTNDLGMVCLEMGDLEAAEPLLRHSLALAEKRRPPDPADIATSQVNLATLLRQRGDYRESIAYALKGMANYERAHGRRSIHLISALSELGMAHKHLGEYRKAESFYLEALKLAEGKEDVAATDYAMTLNNLGMLYQEIGQYERSLEYLERSRKILESQAPKHHLVATLYNNIGIAHARALRFDKAEEYYRRAVAILEGQDPPPPFLIQPLHNLGHLYLVRGDPDRAAKYLRRSLALCKDPEQPEAVFIRFALGLVEEVRGNFTAAEKLFLATRKSLERTHGTDHPTYAMLLLELALVRQAAGEAGEALALADDALQIQQNKVEEVFGFSSEAGMRDYVASVRSGLNLLLSMCLAQRSTTADEAGLQWALRRKGLIFDALLRFREGERLLANDPAVRDKAARLRALRQQMSQLPFGRGKTMTALQLANARAELAAAIDRLQAELNRAVFEARPRHIGTVDVAAVRGRLPAGGVLVEFVRFSRHDFAKGVFEQADDSDRYVAFLLHAERSRPVRLVDLGAAKKIDEALTAFRKHQEQFADAYRDCRTPEERQVLEKEREKELHTTSRRLHRLLFAPLAKDLAGATTIYLAPDAELNFLPFEALMGEDGKYLIETHRFAYLTSGRDLLKARVKPATGAVVFAGPDYDLDAGAKKKILAKLSVRLSGGEVRGPSGAVLRGVSWKELPGARAEADDIAAALARSRYAPVTAYVGASALEEALKALKPPRLLHIATHGFYLDLAPAKGLRKGAGAGWALGRLQQMDNPLLRSGIVLAGANTVGDRGAEPAAEDGWVTAEEVSLLDLRGTELVVLSACQTGMGDVRSGEGVYGLRRAFFYAGARSLVTSLFHVPDAETRALMRAFYRELGAGRGRLEALRAAQLEMVRQRRAAGGAAHPFFWAAFVLVGEPD